MRYIDGQNAGSVACVLASTLFLFVSAAAAQLASDTLIFCADENVSFVKSWNLKATLFVVAFAFAVPLFLPKLLFAFRCWRWWETRPYLRWVYVAVGPLAVGLFAFAFLPWLGSSFPDAWGHCAAKVFSVNPGYFSCSDRFDASGLQLAFLVPTDDFSAARQFARMLLGYLLLAGFAAGAYYAITLCGASIRNARRSLSVD